MTADDPRQARTGELERMTERAYLEGMRYGAVAAAGTPRPTPRPEHPEQVAWLRGFDIGHHFRGTPFEPLPAVVAESVLAWWRAFGAA